MQVTITRQTLEYVEEIGLNTLIDNNRSAKLRNGHSNENKFHKDNMNYNIQEDYFTCYNQEKLFYQETKIKWDEKKQDYNIQRKYYNKKKHVLTVNILMNVVQLNIGLLVFLEEF